MTGKNQLGSNEKIKQILLMHKDVLDEYKDLIPFMEIQDKLKKFNKIIELAVHMSNEGLEMKDALLIAKKKMITLSNER